LQTKIQKFVTYGLLVYNTIMSKQRIIIILGVLVVIMPYLGFPTSWRKGFFLLAGITIVICGYKISKEIKSLKADGENSLTAFKDNLDEHKPNKETI